MSELEIDCPGCGMETLLVRERVYDGFVRTGETLRCSNCGHLFESQAAVPFKSQDQISVFDESDRSRPIEIFGDDEKHILCRYCCHYVVNPFRQWCSLHKKEVEATDTCGQFEMKKDEVE